MSSQTCVILSGGGWVGITGSSSFLVSGPFQGVGYLWSHVPWGALVVVRVSRGRGGWVSGVHPPELQKRVIRILLECFLVSD